MAYTRLQIERWGFLSAFNVLFIGVHQWSMLCSAATGSAFPATPRRVRHRPFKLQQRPRFFADVQSATKCSLLMWPASVFQTNHGREQRHCYRLHLAAKRILRGGPDICICVLYLQLLSSKQMHACVHLYVHMHIQYSFWCYCITCVFPQAGFGSSTDNSSTGFGNAIILIGAFLVILLNHWAIINGFLVTIRFVLC